MSTVVLYCLCISSFFYINHTTKTVSAKGVGSLDGHGKFACNVIFLKAIVDGRFTLTIDKMKR